MSQLTQALQKTVSWLEKNNPNDLCDLESGLSILEIEKITKDFPFQLSAEVIELYQFCNGGLHIADDVMTLKSLEEAIESVHLWGGFLSNSHPNFQYNALPLVNSTGKDIFYTFCEHEKKQSSPIWYRHIHTEPELCADSLTSLMLAVAECSQEDAFYLVEEENEIFTETHGEKCFAIFQKYLPQQADFWHEFWID